MSEPAGSLLPLRCSGVYTCQVAKQCRVMPSNMSSAMLSECGGLQRMLCTMREKPPHAHTNTNLHWRKQLTCIFPDNGYEALAREPAEISPTAMGRTPPVGLRRATSPAPPSTEETQAGARP